MTITNGTISGLFGLLLLTYLGFVALTPTPLNLIIFFVLVAATVGTYFIEVIVGMMQ